MIELIHFIWLKLAIFNTYLPRVWPFPENGFDFVGLKSSWRWSSMLTGTILPCWRNSGGNSLAYKLILTFLIYYHKKLNSLKSLSTHPFVMYSKNSLFFWSSYNRSSLSLIVKPWRHNLKIIGSILSVERDDVSANKTWSSFVWPNR